MNSKTPTPFEAVPAPHPGGVVVEYLDFHGWSQRDLARRTGLTPKTISEICNGKAPITPPTALAFEKVLQRPAHLWLNLQRRFDEAEERRRQHSKSAEWGTWARCFPLKEMRRLNFSLPAGSSDADTVLKFFGVSSPESWRSVWEASSVAFRQTRVFTARAEAIAAWVREAEIVAGGLDVAEFDEDRLRSSLGALRRLTREPADQITDPIQGICARAGVAVVLVPELPQTRISGCARWLGERRGLVGLTLRYKTDDQLWFTFFHEIGHLLLHRHRRSFVVDNAAEDLGDRVVDPEMEQYEEEANRFAADTLIPPAALGDFLRRKTFTNDSIHDFAEVVGVGPGIVVGRLQHDGVLAHHQGNKLKQRLNWTFATEE
ncbi:MAG: HigA family addiction module antidote protein [Gemmataceae bacterium]|nr:HigA family addiction module antidote protein [Gemmataceae bacterium]